MKTLTEKQRERVIFDNLVAVVRLFEEVGLVIFEHSIYKKHWFRKLSMWTFEKIDLEPKIPISKMLWIGRIDTQKI